MLCELTEPNETEPERWANKKSYLLNDLLFLTGDLDRDFCTSLNPLAFLMSLFWGLHSSFRSLSCSGDSVFTLLFEACLLGLLSSCRCRSTLGLPLEERCRCFICFCDLCTDLLRERLHDLFWDRVRALRRGRVGDLCLDRLRDL